MGKRESQKNADSIFITGIVICVIMLLSYTATTHSAEVEFFTPEIRETPTGLLYHSSTLGGYRFTIASKWRDSTNQSALDKLNIIVFLRDSDQTQSLTLTLGVTPESEKGKPIDVKNRVEKSLIKKGIKHEIVSSKIYKIGDRDVEEVDVSLGNNRMMYVIGSFCGHLTMTGNLGYKANDPSTKQDLVGVFKTFQID